VRAWVTKSRGREGKKRREGEGGCVEHEGERKKERKEEVGGGEIGSKGKKGEKKKKIR
jgi:hypothetical protein